MDYVLNILQEFIADYGLPTAMCIALFAYLVKSDKEHKEERDKWWSATEQARQEYQEVVKDNTEAMQKLTVLIDRVTDR